jgi:hypothetical protein
MTMCSVRVLVSNIFRTAVISESHILATRGDASHYYRKHYTLLLVFALGLMAAWVVTSNKEDSRGC